MNRLTHSGFVFRCSASLTDPLLRTFALGDGTRVGHFAWIDLGGMPFRFPRSSFHGGQIIDAHSLDSLPADDDLANDPAPVRFRSIAEILVRGIQRCVAEDRQRETANDLYQSIIKATKAELPHLELSTLKFMPV